MPCLARLLLFFLCASFSRALVPSAFAVEDYSFFHENVMGTSLELHVLASSPEAARWAEECVLREIDRLSGIFSGYDKNSEFSRWQSGAKAPVRVSEELFELMTACDFWRTKGAGAFDPRVEILTLLYARGARENRMPTAQELADAKANMLFPAWRLERESHTALRLSDCPLSLNGIAKGYIIERACTAAWQSERGVLGLLLNVGGDIRVCGQAPRVIGISSPWADSESSEPVGLIVVKDRAVATSGNSQRGFQIGEHWYSHVLDPRTGLPVDRVVSATVVAPRSADADALAKVFSVLSTAESLRLASSLTDVDCLIMTREGGVARTRGWYGYETQPAAPDAPAGPPRALAVAATPTRTDDDPPATESASWADQFELAVNFEINQPDSAGRRYRRPYVAVWVENKDSFPVRNLTLWVSQGGAGPYQWLPDLKRWYKADQVRKELDKKDLVHTTARPTRPPGKYKVIWDGKDDLGRPTPAGEYTLFIDAAREHGTYQSIRKTVSLSDKPFSEGLPGNVEIKSASVEYRRKAQSKSSH
jgi:thiamine biosynthesis lipoprotein ApbE